jgi:hypothetical protein
MSFPHPGSPASDDPGLEQGGQHTATIIGPAASECPWEQLACHHQNVRSFGKSVAPGERHR